MHENELISAAEEPEFEYEESKRKEKKRQAGEEDQLELMKKSVETFNTAKKKKG